MNTNHGDRRGPGGDGESYGVVRTVVDEICREELQDAAVERVVTRALRIDDARFHSRLNSDGRNAMEIDRPAEADVATWQRQHPEVVACLNPRQKRRTFLKRTVTIAAALASLVLLWFAALHFTSDGRGGMAFAQTIARIEKAKSIAWKETQYTYRSDGDGKGTWVQSEEEHAYRAPGLYRQVLMTSDEEPEEYVTITDAVHKKELTLWPERENAYLKEVAIKTHDPDGPFTFALEEMKEGNLQWVGRKKTVAGEVNVFRRPMGPYWSVDLWIDPETKEFVGQQIPGADIYDPDNDPGRDDPIGENWPNGAAICSVLYAIDFDAKLDDSQFSFVPPEDYTVHTQKRNYVTEQEMIDFIGILANLNDKTFPGRTRLNKLSLDVPSRDRREQIWAKPEEERTAAELKYIETIWHYIDENLNQMPIFHFITDNAVENSFRYFGKGVALGDENAIVCWYKLKGANAFRVVYGDLSVKDVAEEDLPLPVQP